MGACLLLEYGVASSAVAVGWGEYLNELLRSTTGMSLPAELSAPPGEGGVVNVPAAVLVGLCCLLLVRGARESALVNTITVGIKIAVLVLFIAVAMERSLREPDLRPVGIAGPTMASSVFFPHRHGPRPTAEEVRDLRCTLPLAIFCRS